MPSNPLVILVMIILVAIGLAPIVEYLLNVALKGVIHIRSKANRIRENTPFWREHQKGGHRLKDVVPISAHRPRQAELAPKSRSA